MMDFEGKKMKESNEIPIVELFKEFEIVILGEIHGTHTDEILSILEKSHSLIEGVLIELPVNYQEDVDTYMETGEVTEALESHFKGAEREGKNVRGILLIFDFLKLHNKSITCIDSSKKPTSVYNKRSTHGYYFLKGVSRDEDMLTMIQDCYNRRPGKYLGIVGAGHIESEKDQWTGEDSLDTQMAKNFQGKYIALPLNS